MLPTPGSGSFRSSVHVTFWFAILALCAIPAAALDPARKLWHYGYSHWQDRDGLPQNTVQAIAQTPDGYIWLGTEAGLVRFNGRAFHVFDTTNTSHLRSNSITALATDSQGTLWVGTRGGLLSYQKGKFLAHEGLPNDTVRTLAAGAGGAVWAGTNGGVARLVGGRVTGTWTASQGLTSSAVRSLALSPEGPWAGSAGGLNLLQAERALPPPVALPRDTVRALCLDRRGRLWIGTENSGLYDSGGRRFTTRQGLTSNSIRALLEDRDGNLWIGTIGGGLNRMRDGRVDTMTGNEGLASDHVRALFEDREGSIWIGAEAGGLAQLRNARAVTYTAIDGLRSDFIRAVYAGADGSIWAGTEGSGLHRLENDRFQPDRSLPVRNAFITALHVDAGGTRWVGTEGAGAFRVTPGGTQAVAGTRSPSDNSVWSIASTADRTVWLGSSNGLIRYRSGETRVYTTADGLRGNTIRALHAARDGWLWIATRNTGLQRMRDESIESIPLPSSFPPAAITSFLELRDGGLWITSNAGLLHWDGTRIQTFTSHHGLRSDALFQALDDAQGRVWLSSSRGIFAVSPRDLLRNGRTHPETITTADGLRTNECSSDAQPAGARAPDGSLWFATIRGVVRIQPDAPHAPPEASVVIEEVAVNGQVTNRHTSPPGNRLFAAKFAALTFLAPDSTRYRYRLDGLDADWIATAGQTEAVYHGVPPGRYVFRVQASADGHTWTGAAAEWPLHVEPHFYQTVWFYFFTGAAILGLAYGAHNLRAANMQREFEAVLRERTRIAREIHDTLMQGFAGAALQLNAISKRWRNDPDSARRQLDGVMTQIDGCLAEARHEIGELRDHSESPAPFLERLRSAAQGATDITVTGHPRPLPADVERNLLRIAQEAVANALRHAQAGRIKIGLEFSPGEIRLTARDNGLGMPPIIAEGHFGLIGMRERAESLGGRFALRTEPNRGTEIEVAIPA